MANHTFWETLNKRKQFPAIMNFNNNNNNNTSSNNDNDNDNNNNNIDNKIGNLEKKTGLFDLCGIGIVCTFGIGAFILIGYISKYITGPSIILSIGIAAAVAMLSGLFYAELGSRISNSSTYTYTYICIGEFIAFVTGWNLIMEYVIGVATVSKGISLYLDILLNDTLKSTFIDIAPIQWTFLSNYFDFLALVIPIVAGFALIIGLKKTTPINIIICVLGVGATLAIIIICIFRGDTINWISEPEINEFIDNAGFFPFGADGMIKGIAIVMFIFIFMDCYTLSNVKISQPHRTMPMSQFVIIISITLLIFGIATSQTFLYSYKFQDENAALPQILIDLNMSAMFWIITIFGIIFMCISLFGLMQPIPVILMSMADDGLIFEMFAKKNIKSNTPIIGICTFSILAGVFAGLFSIGQLINLLSIGTLFAFIVMAIAILIVRYSTELHYESTTTIDINENVNNRILKNDKVTGFSFIMELFSCHCKSAPTQTSQVLFKTLLYILCIFSLGLALMFRFAYDNLRNLESWAMGLAEAFLVIIILSVLGISLRPRQKQYSKISSFIVPLVPLLPAISILINMYLILILDVYAWIRFGVWMIIGIPIYLICTIKKRNELNNKDKQFKEANVNNGFIADEIVIVKNNENAIVIEEDDNHLSGQRIKLKDDDKIVDAIDENLQNHIIELNNGEVEELEVVQSDGHDNQKTKSIKKHRAPLPFVDKHSEEEVIDEVIISPLSSPSDEYGKTIKENGVTEVNKINEQHQQQTATTSINDIVMESFDDLNEITDKKEPNGKINFIEETKNEPIILLGSTSNHHIDLNAEKDEKTAIALLDDILKTEESYPKSPDETSIDSLPVMMSTQQSVTAEVHKEQDDNIDKFEKPQTPILLQRKHNQPLSLIIANDKMNIEDVNDNNNNNNNKSPVSPISPAISDTDDLTSGNTQKFKDKLTLLIRQQTPHEPIRKIFQIEDDSMVDSKTQDNTNNANADLMSSSLISKSANDLSSSSINTTNDDDNNQRNYATLPISTQHNQIKGDAIPPAPKFDPILYKTIGAKYDHKHYDRPNIHLMVKPIQDHQQHESDHEDVVIRKISRDKHHDDHKDIDRDSVGKNTDPEDNHSVQLNRMTSIKDKLELILQRGPPNRYSRPKSNKTNNNARESDSSVTTDDEQNRRQSSNTKSATITNDMQSDDSNRKKTNVFDYETINFKEARKPFDTVHKQKVLFSDVLKSINADTRPSLIRSNSPKRTRTPKPTSIEGARQALKPIKQQSIGESIETKDNNS